MSKALRTAPSVVSGKKKMLAHYKVAWLRKDSPVERRDPPWKVMENSPIAKRAKTPTTTGFLRAGHFRGVARFFRHFLAHTLREPLKGDWNTRNGDYPS